MYEVQDDTYCYPGTIVLRNRLDLKDPEQLGAFEAEITDQRASEALPEGMLDYAHYRAVHHHLFQDVYDWAGQARRVRISKGGNPFCFPEYIDSQMEGLFAALANNNYLRGLDAKAFAQGAAHFLAELNAIHPFREGNGRAQLSFLTLLAEEAGHPLDFDRLDPQGLLEATIESFGGDEAGLEKQIAAIL
ncbi:MAG: adenosine monophosphate-protein transferase [Rhizobium sp.]|nr:adenosine monophosphate-protein transferase [Rhizobium sp.]